jgi:hypothetical protein
MKTQNEKLIQPVQQQIAKIENPDSSSRHKDKIIFACQKKINRSIQLFYLEDSSMYHF